MSPSLLASDPSNWIHSAPPTQLLPRCPAGVFWCAADYPNDQRGGRVVGRMQVTKPQWRPGDSSNPVLRGVQDLAQDPAQDQTDAVGRYREGMSRLARITSDPAICHGNPTIRGLRYTVEGVLELLAAGMTVEDVPVDTPDLGRDDILAALEFGARAATGRVVPLSAA
jgi:uncharacterized protein (DUF433 family)